MFSHRMANVSVADVRLDVERSGAHGNGPGPRVGVNLMPPDTDPSKRATRGSGVRGVPTVGDVVTLSDAADVFAGSVDVLGHAEPASGSGHRPARGGCEALSVDPGAGNGVPGVGPLPRIGSLFSGAAMLDRAVHRVVGGSLAWFVENDPAASKVLAHHFPDVKNYGDITKIDWVAVEPVDVLTGGFPCVDISNIGNREGIGGARSGLWSHYVDAIRVLRPRLVVIENVAVLAVRGLDRVLADLARIGFDAEWTTLPASGVGSCHERKRLFIAARPVADPVAGGCGTAGRHDGIRPAGLVEVPAPGTVGLRRWDRLHPSCSTVGRRLR